MEELFRKFATKVSHIAGSAYLFFLALLLIITWAITGPIFNYSNTWQLIINTCTTVVTFLMVFLIQNTQNRDSRAVHLKLDELIKALSGARDSLMNVEELSEEELNHLQEEFRCLQEKYMNSHFTKKGKLKLTKQIEPEN